MMKYNPKIHNRRSIRLKGYDYSPAGLYYITICVQDREYLFGKIVETEMQLNEAGKMVKKEWIEIPNRFPQIQLHEFIVMPNHFHAIMEITSSTVGASLVGALNGSDTRYETGTHDNEQGRPQGYAPTDAPTNCPTGISPADYNKTVGDVVGAFKSITTNEYIGGVKNHNWPRFNGKLWQRNYWEHIIRDEKSYQRISDYIINNPRNWAADKLYHA